MSGSAARSIVPQGGVIPDERRMAHTLETLPRSVHCNQTLCLYIKRWRSSSPRNAPIYKGAFAKVETMPSLQFSVPEPSRTIPGQGRQYARVPSIAGIARWLAVVIIVACSLAGGAGPTRAATDVSYASAQAAYDQGVGALRVGKLEIAVTALEYAGNQSHVPALYMLGTVYANNDERLTDHAKAFNVFHRIVERYAYVDPMSDFRSVYVVRAAVRLADYYRSGVPALGLAPDPRAAVELLNHAAAYFGDLEAQFQLAKMHLTGEGVEGNERYGLHWLSRLAHKGHAGAQAFLAELMWRGKFVHKDPNQALVWGTLAVEGASEQDRMWIEDVYQTIYCGAAPGVRERAGQLVADWRRRAPAMTSSEPQAPGAIANSAVAEVAPAARSGGHAAVRTCANGETVPSLGARQRGGVEPMPVIDVPDVRGALPLPSSTAKGSIPVRPASGEPDEARSGVTGGSGTPMATPLGKRPAAFGDGFTEFDKAPAASRR